MADAQPLFEVGVFLDARRSHHHPARHGLPGHFEGLGVLLGETRTVGFRAAADDQVILPDAEGMSEKQGESGEGGALAMTEWNGEG